MDAMTTNTSDPGAAAFDAFRTKVIEDHAERCRQNGNTREFEEYTIREQWESELERRARHDAKRASQLAERFPVRAVEAARGADPTSPALQALAAWAVEHSDGVAVLAGAPGCGKTVAATWWALQQQHAPEFVRASEYARSSRYDEVARKRWTSAHALVLDDLGAEYLDAKGSFRVDLDELVDVYYGNKRRLVITTNCTAEEFRARYGERVVDRMRESGTWLAVTGGSMRGRSR